MLLYVFCSGCSSSHHASDSAFKIRIYGCYILFSLILVVERWMPWSVKHGISLWSTSLDTVRQVRHSLVNYISLDIGDIVWVHSLWRYCIPASWHFTVHPHLPIQETKWQLTWLWHVWYFICDDTLSQSQYHGNIMLYIYTLLRPVILNISTNVGNIPPHWN